MLSPGRSLIQFVAERSLKIAAVLVALFSEH